MPTIFTLYLVFASLIVSGLIAIFVYDWHQCKSKLQQLRSNLARKINLTISGPLPKPRPSTMNVGLTRAKLQPTQSTKLGE